MERLVFNRDEHFQYTKGHEDNILKAHLGNKRLYAISVGEGDEIEKEPMLCGKGHEFIRKDGPRRDQGGSVSKD